MATNTRTPDAPPAPARSRQPRNPLDAELRLIRQIESRYHRLTPDGRAMVVRLLTAHQEDPADV